MSKLNSRKLWVTVGTIVSIVLADAFGIAVDPEAIVGIGVLVGTYVLGQGWVDASTVKAEVSAGADVARFQAIAYARSLEAQLAELGAQAPSEEGLTVVE